MTMTSQTDLCISPYDVEAIMHDISDTLLPHPGLNERYVHHAFSHLLQFRFPCLDVAAPHDTLLLHPEWPTAKQSTKIANAWYRKTNGCYQPVGEGEGTAGFIDFAIGSYSAPVIGIEFSLKKGWSHQEIVYDFLKLIDRRNPFKAAFSHNLIIRPNNLSMGSSREDLEDHINGALRQAIDRLEGIGCADKRDVRLIVSEIATHERRHWHYEPVTRIFLEGLGGSYRSQ